MIRIQPSASVYPLGLSSELLAIAFQNTVALLTKAVVVDAPAAPAKTSP